jgi:response regulator RpfG family c-di-GMP phosphodiesterase
LLSRIKESLDLYEKLIENKRLNELTKRQNEKLNEFNRTLEQRVDEQTGTIKEQNKELASSFMEIIKSFSTIIEIRLKDVGSHSQRVASLAKRIIKGFELNQKEYQDIVMAAFLHDIGKIGLTDKCLKKDKGVQTGPDFEEIAKHPILGQSCLCAITGFEEIGVIIRHHHEDYDGSGYPDNLRERKIPFGSRVIRIADSFDNHAFKNGYPNSRRLNDASARLVKYSGSKFDPELVKKFIEADIAKQYVLEETSKVIELKPTELQENMIVAEDVYSRTDMFLLPRGAKLSEGMIRRLIKINKVDPIKQGVQVYKPGAVKRKEKEYATV